MQNEISPHQSLVDIVEVKQEMMTNEDIKLKGKLKEYWSRLPIEERAEKIGIAAKRHRQVCTMYNKMMDKLVV